MPVSTWDLIAGALGLGRGRSGEFRYADIPAERGRYARAFAGYATYLGAHGHPAPLRSGADARRLYGQLAAARPARLAEVTALLAREGVPAAPTPEAWDGIGAWLDGELEPSAEPGVPPPGSPAAATFASTSPDAVRPLWRSILLDLAFLLGEHAVARAGRGRWAFAGDLEPAAPFTAPAPVVVCDAPGGENRLDPFGLLHQHAGTVLAHKLGRPPARPAALGDALHALATQPAAADAPAAELEAWLQRHVDQQGDLPPSAEIAAYMVDADLPPETLPERFRTILDARERRR